MGSILVVSDPQDFTVVSVGEQGPAGTGSGGGGGGGAASELLVHNGELLFSDDGDVVVTET